MFFNRIKRGLLNIVKPIEDASVVLMTETSAWRNEVINEKAQERKAQRTKKEYDKEAIKSYFSEMKETDDMLDELYK